jgi:hypothetical protein
MSEIDRRQKYNLVRGTIHGREKTSRAIYGVFLGVSAGFKQYYLKTRFILEPVDKDMPWKDFISILDAPDLEEEDEERDETLQRYGTRLQSFIETDRLLFSDKRDLDPKTIERKITYYCADDLDFSSMTFVDITSESADNIYSLLPSLKTGSDGGGANDENREDKESGEEQSEEVFIECEAVIDPVAGVPVQKLSIGQQVCCRLPEESPFYKICRTSLPDFDGVVIGAITGVKTNEFGNSVIATSLAEGISGAMKVKGNVWIKIAQEISEAPKVIGYELPRNIILGAIGVSALLLAIGILFHFLA